MARLCCLRGTLLLAELGIKMCEILTFSSAIWKQFWMTLTLATPPKSCEYLPDPFALYPPTHVFKNTPGS